MIKLLKNLFKIAKLLSTDDSGDLRFGVVSILGKQQKILLHTPYGLMHHPPASSMITVWSQLAQESNGVGIADDPKNRTLKSLKEGEVAVGNYVTGDYVVFKDGNIVNLVVGSTLNVTAPTVNVTSTDITVNASTSIDLITKDMTISGDTFEIISDDVKFTGTDLTHNGINVGDTHIHSQGNDSDNDSEVDTGGPHS